MELRQLVHFLAVTEDGSFSSAAARLNMVQSSLSASVLALERELGTDLFIRGRRGVELTDAGRALREPAQATLESLDRARDSVSEITGLMRGSVRVATPVLPPNLDITPTIRRFQDQHPEVNVQLMPGGARRMIDLVASGQADFAISPRVPDMGSGLRFEPLVRSPLVILCPADHRLAGVREVDLQQVVEESLIELSRGWWARELFDTLLKKRNLERRTPFEVGDWMSVLSLVNRGLGASYGPEVLIDRNLFYRIKSGTIAEAPHWELGVVTRNGGLRGTAGRHLLAAFREECRARIALKYQVSEGPLASPGPKPPPFINRKDL